MGKEWATGLLTGRQAAKFTGPPPGLPLNGGQCHAACRAGVASQARPAPSGRASPSTLGWAVLGRAKKPGLVLGRWSRAACPFIHWHVYIAADVHRWRQTMEWSKLGEAGVLAPATAAT
jgi:hypothetical protein